MRSRDLLLSKKRPDFWQGRCGPVRRRGGVHRSRTLKGKSKVTFCCDQRYANAATGS